MRPLAPDVDLDALAAATEGHSGADVIRVVADLCGGWEAMRSISPVLRILGYEDHHDPEGKPI